jgi:nucleoside-diphosphate-sugar epimerase
MIDKKKKKIAIIGGSGFIGTQLIKDLIPSNHEIVIIDKVPSITFPELSIVCDIRDKSSLNKALKSVTAIYNLAAEHKDDVSPISLYYDVNVAGAKNIIDGANNHNIKEIYFTSTVAVYGLDHVDAIESSPTTPFNDYGESKLQAEKEFISWKESSPDNKLIIVRPTVVFGPKNRGNVYNLINQVSRNRFLFIGNGKNAKSLAYIKNISSFLSTCLSQKSKFEIFNYADKPDLDMNYLISTLHQYLKISPKVNFHIPFVIGLMGGYLFDLISFISRRKLPISSVRIKKFCANSKINTSKLLATEFKAPYSIEDGLKETIEKDFTRK